MDCDKILVFRKERIRKYVVREIKNDIKLFIIQFTWRYEYDIIHEGFRTSLGMTLFTYFLNK